MFVIADILLRNQWRRTQASSDPTSHVIWHYGCANVYAIAVRRAVLGARESFCTQPYGIMTDKKLDARRRLDQIVNQLRDSPVSFAGVDDAAAERSLQGKSIFVTGGANGLGECYTRRFADLGAFVLIADLDATRGEALEKELLAQGRR